MKETKVYVDELPKSCVGCKYFAEHRRQCNLELCLQWSEVKFKFDDCPLKSLHDHDKELVAKVLEEVENAFTEYLPLKNRTGAWFYGRLNGILKNIKRSLKMKSERDLFLDTIKEIVETNNWDGNKDKKIEYLQSQLDQQKAMWNELKEWANYLCYFELVDKMQELEAEE